MNSLAVESSQLLELEGYPMLEFLLLGQIVAKQKPRFHSGHGKLPTKYRTWKEAAVESIRQQLPSDFDEPWQSARVLVQISGHGRNDLDTLLGSLLAALTQAGVLADDRAGVVRRLTIEAMEGEPGAILVIEPW